MRMIERFARGWVQSWARLSPMRLLALALLLFAVAIIQRPHAGAVGFTAQQVGVSPLLLAGFMLGCGLVAAVSPPNELWFLLLSIPLLLYSLAVLNWAWDKDQPLTAIVTAFLNLVLLLRLNVFVGGGNGRNT